MPFVPLMLHMKTSPDCARHHTSGTPAETNQRAVESFTWPAQVFIDTGSEASLAFRRVAGQLLVHGWDHLVPRTATQSIHQRVTKLCSHVFQHAPGARSANLAHSFRSTGRRGDDVPRAFDDDEDCWCHHDGIIHAYSLVLSSSYGG